MFYCSGLVAKGSVIIYSLRGGVGWSNWGDEKILIVPELNLSVPHGKMYSNENLQITYYKEKYLPYSG